MSKNSISGQEEVLNVYCIMMKFVTLDFGLQLAGTTNKTRPSANPGGPKTHGSSRSGSSTLQGVKKILCFQQTETQFVDNWNQGNFTVHCTHKKYGQVDHAHKQNQSVYQRIGGSVHPGAGALPLERVPRGLAHGIVVELEPDPAGGVVHVGPVVALVAGFAIKKHKKKKNNHLKNPLKCFVFGVF